MRQPTPRSKVFDEYWRFAAERQTIFHRRARGEPAPWTSDDVLRRYKFCNAYRASDRVSQYLIKQVIYASAARDLPPDDVFLRVVLFRLFSKETTWEALEHVTGGVRRATLDTDLLGDALDELRQRRSIYTAAFILAPRDVYGFETKHRNHLALVTAMFRPGQLAKQIAEARSLQAVYEALIRWPMIGPFMGYQLAIDLNYTEHLSFSEDDFTVPGPGAVRGLSKVFEDFGDYTPSQLITRMVDRQEEEFDRLGIPFENLFGRRLHAIDCQGLFCETDKLSRVRFPELKSNRVRIKQEFTPTPGTLDLFYPPKWSINGTIASAPAQDQRGTPSALLPPLPLSEPAPAPPIPPHEIAVSEFNTAAGCDLLPLRATDSSPSA